MISLALFACLLWISIAVTEVSGLPVQAPSVREGAYTEEQAVHGQMLYYQHCLSCHGETMEGLDQAPALAGPQFSGIWNGEPLLALAGRIDAMPPGKPDSLSWEASVDILTYILWYNGLPSGNEPLGDARAALAQMTFEAPPPGR